MAAISVCRLLNDPCDIALEKQAFRNACLITIIGLIVSCITGHIQKQSPPLPAHRRRRPLVA